MSNVSPCERPRYADLGWAKKVETLLSGLIKNFSLANMHGNRVLFN